MTNARQSYDERGKGKGHPVAPEPGAHLAGLLLASAIIAMLVRYMRQRR